MNKKIDGGTGRIVGGDNGGWDDHSEQEPERNKPKYTLAEALERSKARKDAEILETKRRLSYLLVEKGATRNDITENELNIISLLAKDNQIQEFLKTT